MKDQEERNFSLPSELSPASGKTRKSPSQREGSSPSSSSLDHRRCSQDTSGAAYSPSSQPPESKRRQQAPVSWERSQAPRLRCTGLGSSAVRGILPDQESNPRLLQWQVDSSSLSHQAEAQRPLLGSQMALVIKNLSANAGDVRDTGSIPGSGKSPGGGNGDPLQYSCLENPINRGAWWATIHAVSKSQMRLEGLSMEHPGRSLVSKGKERVEEAFQRGQIWPKEKEMMESPQGLAPPGGNSPLGLSAPSRCQGGPSSAQAGPRRPGSLQQGNKA